MLSAFQIDHLVHLIRGVSGRNNGVAGEEVVYWVDGHTNTMRQVTGASLEFFDPEHDDDVSEPVAFLQGGGYIALNNCDLHDFKHLRQVEL